MTLERPKNIPAEPSETPLQAAFRVWEQFVVCHRDYDPKLASLYSKVAHLEQVGRMAGCDRVVLRLRFDPKQWKRLMPKLMAEANARGDRSRFSDWSFEEQPQSVVVSARRHSELNGSSAPHRLVMAPADDGEWLIVEEVMNVV